MVGKNKLGTQSGVENLLKSFGPLRLLVPTAAAETADLLRKAATTSDLITISGGEPDQIGCNIQCKGVQLNISVETDAGDISGFKNVFCNIDQNLVGSAVSIQLGNHVEGGDRVAPILKAMLSAAAIIGQITGAFGVMWVPARTISGFDFYVRGVTDYDEGGVFPVLALVNFKKCDDGNVRSTGLEWLTGQELVAAQSNWSDAELMRRIVRVAHDLAVGGAVTGETELPGIEAGERIILTPDIANRTLKMQTVATLVQ